MKEFKLDLIPYVSIGPLKFGMTAKEIRKIMADYDQNGSTFKRNIMVDKETDSHFGSNFFIGYDENGIFDFVEVVDMDITYKGKIINILSEKELFKLSNNNYELVGDNYFLDELGVSMSFDLVAGAEEFTDGNDSILVTSKKEYLETKEVYKNFYNK
jgi:hypothetical protein